MAANTPKLDDLIDKVLEEIQSVQAQSPDEHKAWLRELRMIPPSIPLGDARQVITTSGIAAIHEFGRRWRDEDASRKASIGEEQAAQLAVHVFGQLLAGIDLDAYPAETPVKKVLKELLDKRLRAIGKPLTHHIPCQLFEQGGVPAFDIGPVRLMPPSEWLDDVEGRAGRALSWVPQVRAYWEGQAKAPSTPRPFGFSPRLRRVPYLARVVAWMEQFLSQRSSGRDGWTAHDIVDAFAGCGWVAVVEVADRERLRSRECAEIAVQFEKDHSSRSRRYSVFTQPGSWPCENALAEA